MSTQAPQTSPPSNIASPPPPSTNISFSPPSPPTNSSTSSPPTNSTGSSPSPPPTNETALTPPEGNGLPPGTLAGLIVGTGLGAIIVLVGVGICFIFYRRRKKREVERLCPAHPDSGPKDDHNAGGLHLNWQHGTPPPTDDKVTGMPMPTSPLGLGLDPLLSLQAQNTFSYEELARATNNFSNSNLLGQGGFGNVHKGILPNGKVVAVKQLKAGSGQGEREFRAEIVIISRVHHRHLVSLIGYCIEGIQRMLVYEFVPNNTLEFHLHGKGRPTMDWSTRMRIAIGSAKGLAYLHEDCRPKIIHRDIKAANILLDDKFEAKVADFGLARYSFETDTHVSTRVMGTFGYLAPEYASTGKLTEKSDNFSFGVVLLELITGRRPVDRSKSFLDDSIVDDSLVDWARPLMQQALGNGNFDALVDPKLQKDYDLEEMTRMISCAAACVRYSARLRPRMNEIVRALEGNMSLDGLNGEIPPGHSVIFSPYGSIDYSSGQYKEDLKKFRKMALETQEQGSTEYSGATSDYALQPSTSSTDGQQTTQEMELQRKEESIKDTTTENSQKLD